MECSVRPAADVLHVGPAEHNIWAQPEGADQPSTHVSRWPVAAADLALPYRHCIRALSSGSRGLVGLGRVTGNWPTHERYTGHNVRAHYERQLGSFSTRQTSWPFYPVGSNDGR